MKTREFLTENRVMSLMRFFNLLTSNTLISC